MAAGLPAIIHACPICFQVDDAPVVGGVRAAVGVLIGVTTIVLAGFGMFAARFVRRSRELNQ